MCHLTTILDVITSLNAFSTLTATCHDLYMRSAVSGSSPKDFPAEASAGGKKNDGIGELAARYGRKVLLQHGSLTTITILTPTSECGGVFGPNCGATEDCLRFQNIEELSPSKRDPAAFIGTIVGRYLDTWPAGQMISLATAGSISFHANKHVYIDQLGLNDPVIARRDPIPYLTDIQDEPGRASQEGESYAKCAKSCQLWIGAASVTSRAHKSGARYLST